MGNEEVALSCKSIGVFWLSSTGTPFTMQTRTDMQVQKRGKRNALTKVMMVVTGEKLGYLVMGGVLLKAKRDSKHSTGLNNAKEHAEKRS